MRQPTKSELDQLKAKGFMIESVAECSSKLQKDKEFIEKYAIDGTNKAIVMYVPPEVYIYSLDKLYKLGILK